MFSISDPSDALILAQALNCTGSIPVVVEWTGRVAPGVTFSVSNGTLLSIFGSQGAIIDGSDQDQLFYVSSATLHLADLEIVNGFADSGGALHALSSNISVVNCNFTDNRASKHGGAIFAEDDTILTLEDSVYFSGNNASLDGYGGAISLSSSSATIGGISTFEANSADRGGAIYAAHGSELNLTATSHFSGNTARASGGAMFGVASDMYALGDGATAFEVNSASTEFGGAFYWLSEDRESTVSVEAPWTFWMNSGPTGGAMYLSGEELQVLVEGARFESNVASKNGGALLTHAIGQNTDDALIQGCTFKGNAASLDGGAAVISGGFVSIRDSIFHGNQAGEINVALSDARGCRTCVHWNTQEL